MQIPRSVAEPVASLVTALPVVAAPVAAPSVDTIELAAPATCWQQASPTGNGRHGALVLGDPDDESVVVTHHALVLPGTAAPAQAPLLADRLERARELILAGRDDEALAVFTDGRDLTPVSSFHPAFALRLRLRRAGTGRAAGSDRPAGAAPGYRRTTDLPTGVVTVRWADQDGEWRRECFVSRADDVVVLRITRPVTTLGPAGAPWTDLAVSHDVRLPGAPADLRVVARPARAAGTVTGVRTVRVDYPAAGAGGYAGVTRVAVRGSEILLLTRVVRFADGGSETAVRGCRAALAALDADYPALLDRHVAVHGEAYGRVTLELDVEPGVRALPVPELLARARSGSADGPVATALAERCFAAGRYHLLSASGIRPPRLTGLWQGDWEAAWSGAFTLDANLGVQLAGAVAGGVPEAVTGLAELVADQLPHWRVNARRVYGVDGVLAPAHTDGASGAVVHFDARWPLHLWTAAADWLLAVLLDHVRASGDADFLRRYVVPLLVGTARFHAGFLTCRDGGGRVVSVPSYSPENAPLGRTPAAVNATMGLAGARHTLQAAIALAGGALTGGFVAGTLAGTLDDGLAAAGVDAREVARWRDLCRDLPPYRVTAEGALAEWAWPGLLDDDDHRHVSHLFPVWPLHEITPQRDPMLAAAALTALRRRGSEDDSAHGYLHRALVAARLRQADLLGDLLGLLLGGDFWFDTLMTSHYPGRRVFNADAACGLPGVLLEALVDSEPGRLELLPAVPRQLPRGVLRGARTLTRLTVEELRWDLAAGTASAVLVPHASQRLVVGCRGARFELDLRPGHPVPLAVGATGEQPGGNRIAEPGL